MIDATGMIVIPGNVNNHQHFWESLVRGVSSNATPQQHRDVVLDPLPPKLTVDDMYVGTLVGALDALSNGTTTVLNWDPAAAEARPRLSGAAPCHGSLG